MGLKKFSLIANHAELFIRGLLELSITFIVVILIASASISDTPDALDFTTETMTLLEDIHFDVLVFVWACRLTKTLDAKPESYFF